MDSSSKRTRIVGAILAATALIIVGVVMVNNANGTTQAVSLEHAQAIAKAANADTPLSALPTESSVQTPKGWVIESDEPVEGSQGEEEPVSEDEGPEQDAVEEEEDDDIDSPLQIEEDANGEKFVAELGENVIVASDEPAQDGTEVAADGKKKRGCFRGLKACSAKKACYRKCSKKCKLYAIRRCMPKKFSRCFSKYYGKKKMATKCVIYRRKLCLKGLQYRCKRGCKKFCKKVPRCYCCPTRKIRRRCKQTCRRFLYRSKCGRCRCMKMKCYLACRFLCLKKY